MCVRTAWGGARYGRISSYFSRTRYFKCFNFKTPKNSNLNGKYHKTNTAL